MLTDADVKRAKPEDREYALRDDACPGLQLRVKPSGVKSWTLRYRAPTGQRRVTLGRYPVIGLSKARSEARRLIGEVATGGDPSAEKAEKRSALTVADIFGRKDEEGWYLQVHVRTAGRLGTAKTEHSIRTDRCYINKHIRSRRRLLSKPVATVTTADLERIKADLSPGAWRKVRNILRVGFRHAESLGAIPAGANPARRVTATPGRKVERYLSPAERRQLEDAIAKAESLGQRVTGGMRADIARALRILALTGMRLGEVLALRWEHIDWRHGQLRLPTSKTGAKSVPLTPQALDFLRTERGDLSRVGYVCATVDGRRITPSNVQRAWRSLRKAAKLPDVRLHDLRHSWASDAVSAGVPLHVVGAVLGHRSPATTARYAHVHDEALKRALEVTGNAIATATGGVR